MLKSKLFLISLLMSVVGIVRAQQPDIFNQFYMNPYLYNPAYAGVEGHSVLFLMYHQQWTNIENAPRMIHASFHTPLRGGIGIGAAAFNYNQGLLDRSVGKVSASYLITLDRKHYLRFGMSVGAGTQAVNFSELDDPTDPAFTNLGNNTSFMVADFGATYHFDHFNIGFSLPNLVSYDLFTPESFAPVRVTPTDNMIFKMNYRGHINDDIAIEPHLLYRYSKFLPDQYEATVIFHLYHVVWAGATYRQDNNIVATIGTKLKERFAIGYAYEMGNTDLTGFLGPTHEIHLGFHLSRRKSHAVHKHSFIDSERIKSREELLAEQQEQEDQLSNLRETRETEEPPADALPVAVEEETPEVEEKSDWIVDPVHKDIERVNEFGEKEEAFVVEHENEEGELEFALAWKPSGENWTMVTDEKPEKRTAADGTKEVGIIYLKTDSIGKKTQIIKWEPVLTEEELESVLAGEQESETIVADKQPETTETKPPVVIVDPTPADTDPKDEVVETTPEETGIVEKDDGMIVMDTDKDESLSTSRRGGNLLELPVGHYVVAGAFKDFDNAEEYSDELFQKGYYETIVGYVTERELYYVVIHRASSKADATNFKDQVSSRAGMNQVWTFEMTE